MAEIAQQRTRLLDRRQLRLADPHGHRRWHLGAQGNSQLAGSPGRRGGELALRAGHRRRRIEESTPRPSPIARSAR